MKSLRSILVALAFILIAVPTLSAADFGVRAGRFNDIEDNFVGADVWIPLGSNVAFNPNLEYVLADEVDAGSLNADFLFNFGSTNFRPYVGAGLGLFRVDAGDGGSDNTTVVNVIGGVNWRLDFLTPYAQVKYFRSIEDDSEGDDVSIAIGLRF